jgi:hypothetical protein
MHTILWNNHNDQAQQLICSKQYLCVESTGSVFGAVIAREHPLAHCGSPQTIKLLAHVSAQYPHKYSHIAGTVPESTLGNHAMEWVGNDERVIKRSSVCTDTLIATCALAVKFHACVVLSQ